MLSRPQCLYVYLVLFLSAHCVLTRLSTSALWRTYPPNTNYGLIQHLHKAPILDLQWSLNSPLIYTASADHTIGYTDVTTGQRVRRLRAHRGIINALDRTMAAGAGVELLASASDDGTVKVWEGGEEGSKEAVASLEVGCPVTAIAFSLDGTQVFAGALDNEIHVGCSSLTTNCSLILMTNTIQVYDLRSQKEVYSLGGHTDTPISLSVSPNGHYLLAPSLSSTAIIHDIRPFAPAAGGRVHRALTGAPAGFENTLLRGAWSRDDGGRRVAVGGADRTVTVWDTDSGKVLYKVGYLIHTE
jgi:Prp8 binding protein